MKEKRLFELIGMAADEYILEAELELPEHTDGRRTKAGPEREKSCRAKPRCGERIHRYWYLWAAAAATFLLVAGVLGLAAYLMI